VKKYIVALVIAACVLVPFWWFYFHFTIVEASTGGEWLILRAEQTAECKEGDGCAVYSAREVRIRMLELLRRWELHRSQRGGSDT
jgi:hypothetical protein